MAGGVLGLGTFAAYFRTPENLGLYQVANQDDLEAFQYLRTLPRATVMAPSEMSEGLFPITGHKPVGTLIFYGNRLNVEKFFWTGTACGEKEAILGNTGARYILSSRSFGCNWELIYHEHNRYIYRYTPTNE